MNIEEFAHDCANRLSESPKEKNIAEIVNESIDFATTDGFVDENTVYSILDVMSTDLGDLMVVAETYDIQKRLSVANKTRQMAEQRLKAMRTKPTTRPVVKKK